MPSSRTRLLFLCTGNICRSPVAEGVFLHLAKERGVAERFEVDSAGTGAWHVGQRADPGSLAVARQHGVHLPSVARQVTVADFARFDRIIVMDRMNERHVLAMGAPPEKVTLLMRSDPAANILEVPDPYGGGADGFERMYAMIERACRALLDSLLAEIRS